MSPFANPASSILTGISLRKVQFLKRCGTTAWRAFAGISDAFRPRCRTWHTGYPGLVVTESRDPSASRPMQFYRYFSDRSALEAALADEVAQQLELAAEVLNINFARDNRHLYEVMMSLHVPKHDATFRQSLWTFTFEQVKRIAGSDLAAQASVALWAFLHGPVALEAAQVFGESKPASGLEIGLDAWLVAVSIEDNQRGTGEVSAKETVSRQALGC